MTKEMIKVELDELTLFSKKHLGRDWPKAVVDSFGQLADGAADDVKSLTREKFGLHSEYIPKGIKHYPVTSAQKGRAAHALKKYGDMNAAVFLRGASDPRKSLEFMVDHEEGGEREAFGKYIAVPSNTLRAKGFKTGKGKVRKRWKPQELLKRYNQTNARFDGRTTISNGRNIGRGGRRLPGTSFIIGTRSGPAIVRRVFESKGNTRGKNLEFLYFLVPKTRIKKIWGFVNGVYTSVGRHYQGVINSHIKALPGGK